MISGDVHGPVADVGNYNTGVIADEVHIGKFHLNKSTLQSLQLRYLETRWPLSLKSAYNANLGGTAIREACAPGTRVDILKRIYTWAEDPSSNSPTVFCLTGKEESGKSTIAFSVARHFDGQKFDEGESDEEVGTLQYSSKILGANFFCSRQFEETSRKENIIPAIVDQLARQSEPYANALLKANKFNSVNIPSKQMKDLLVDPWTRSVSEHHAQHPLFLIVVDALDEIGGGGGSAFLKELLKMTSKSYLKGIKFLVTSRPDVNIVKLCSAFTSDAVCVLDDVPTDIVKTDIASYLQAKLPKLWGMPEVDDLMHQADGQFVFAAKAVRYITRRPLTKREQIQLLAELGIHAHG